jgi:hypothetical protein
VTQSHSQSRNILDHLQTFGHITPLEALSRYGCFRLAARIEELRKAGHPIYTKMVGDPPHARYIMDQLVLL